MSDFKEKVSTENKNDYEGCIWMMVGNNEWQFGIPVRGFIRKQLAWVWYVSSFPELDKPWRWVNMQNKETGCVNRKGGLQDAIEAAEKSLGISD